MTLKQRVFASTAPSRRAERNGTMIEKTRRSFLTGATVSAALLGACNRSATTGTSGPGSDGRTPSGPADVTLRIGSVLADIAKGHTISTIGYNGAVPGPLIRFKEGVSVSVELF